MTPQQKEKHVRARVEFLLGGNVRVHMLGPEYFEKNDEPIDSIVQKIIGTVPEPLLKYITHEIPKGYRLN